MELKDNVMRLYEPLELKFTITKAKDTKITTKEFGELVDFQSGAWAALIGHNRSEIAEIMCEYGGKLTHSQQYCETEYPEILVNNLITAAGFSDEYKGCFLSSGSEAVLLACALARQISGKTRLLSFTISYHGAVSGLRFPRNQNEWTDLEITECLSCEKDNKCLECKKVKNINFCEYGGFVFEPGNSAGMVLCPPEKLVKYLSENIKKHGGYVIANEITTGFGRTGKWFGHQHYEHLTEKNNNPDFIAMGKGLGNGYPVSAVFAKKHLAKAVKKTKFKYVQSHMNDFFGCRIANEVVKIIKDNDLIEKGRASGEYLSRSINDISGISCVRSRGIMIAAVLEEKFSAYKVFCGLIEKGFYVGFSKVHNYIHLYPPMIISRSEIDGLCAALKECLEEEINA